MSGFIKDASLFLGILAALAGAWLLLHQGSSGVASTGEFDAILRQGQPVLVEFYSDT